MRTRRVHILPLWAQESSGAQPAYHCREERRKCPGQGHGKGRSPSPKATWVGNMPLGRVPWGLIFRVHCPVL